MCTIYKKPTKNVARRVLVARQADEKALHAFLNEIQMAGPQVLIEYRFWEYRFPLKGIWVFSARSA
jgi:hypothetical protein